MTKLGSTKWDKHGYLENNTRDNLYHYIMKSECVECNNIDVNDRVALHKHTMEKGSYIMHFCNNCKTGTRHKIVYLQKNKEAKRMPKGV